MFTELMSFVCLHFFLSPLILTQTKASNRTFILKHLKDLDFGRNGPVLVYLFFTLFFFIFNWLNISLKIQKHKLMHGMKLMKKKIKHLKKTEQHYYLIEQKKSDVQNKSG